MKQIPLTRGMFALVDDRDFEWLNQWKWCAHLSHNEKFRAAREEGARHERKTILMHRLICAATKGVQVDHINGDPLDNQRKNLRVCSASQNQWNRGVQRDNTSGFKGVDWRESHSKWRARIQVFSRMIHLGYFLTAAAAGRAYKAAARKYYGEFART